MLTQFFSQASAKTDPRRPNSRRPIVEQLETRCLLAGDMPCPMAPADDASAEDAPAQEGWIDMLTPDFNEGNRGSKNDTSLEDLIITREMNSARPILMLNAPDGPHEQSIDFVETPADSSSRYLRIEWRDILLTSYGLDDSEEEKEPRFGNSLLGPGGVVDRNGIAANRGTRD